MQNVYEKKVIYLKMETYVPNVATYDRDTCIKK